MRLCLEELPHQEEAVAALVNALSEVLSDYKQDNTSHNFLSHHSQENGHNAPMANPTLVFPPSCTTPYGLDVKMETGTGKTYVYTRTLFELFSRFGLHKFIIFVPSLAIKEGVKKFMTSQEARDHFHALYHGTRLDLTCINAGDFNTKKGRKTIPPALSLFLEGSRNERSIKGLLLNDAMLMSKSMTRDDYDQTLLDGGSCPIESLKAIRPVVIIDEPHRFSKNGKAWAAIQHLNPQLILRFGATFPLQEKTHRPDYARLVYDLNAPQAFNRQLIKWVHIDYPQTDTDKTALTKYTVKAVSNKNLVLVDHAKKEYDIGLGDALPQDFEGHLTYEGEKRLSNDMALEKGLTLIPSIFSCSYQERILAQALNSHFQTERENWVRAQCGENPAKIKTLALFFIDDIHSYRSPDGWLKQTFERLLCEKIKQCLEQETNPDYRDFLATSLTHLSETHGGYFAEDNNKKGDEAIQAEVDDILREKNKLLSFRDDKGQWILRRFLFSKWTLREGWDNPNVFTIAKLRSSGSDISKRQEVGRGLRLPIDENGRRLSHQEFFLTFITDWSEQNFAAELQQEVKADGPTIPEKITPALLTELVKNGYAEDETNAKIKLLQTGVIDTKDTINREKWELLTKDFLPDYSLNPNSIKNKGQKEADIVKLRKEKWEPLKAVWQQLTKRYMVKFLPLENTLLKEILQHAFKNQDQDALTIAKAKIHRDTLTGYNIGEADSNALTQRQQILESDLTLKALPYGTFLKELSRRTLIPINMWHRAFCDHFKNGIETQKFNYVSVQTLAENFKHVVRSHFSQYFEYDSLDFSADTTLMENGDFVDSIKQTILGTEIATDLAVEECYLYDKKVYDSTLEKSILAVHPNKEVSIFGKLPKQCIQVPNFTGGTTSPDFIYAIHTDKETKLHLFIEAKSTNKRESDTLATNAQKKFFQIFKEINIIWREMTDDKLCEVITQLIEENHKEEKSLSSS